MLMCSVIAFVICYKLPKKKVAEHEKKDASGVRGAGAVVGAGSAPSSQQR